MDEAKVEVNSLQLAISKTLWTLFFDGSANEKGCGVRLLLISPCGEQFEHAYFRDSNNEVEYEALLIRLGVAKEIGVSNILILSDSQLIVK